MNRGPMALFGAIVAVGLGPAMWLGAQLGAMNAAPNRPPAVSSEHQPNETPTQQQEGGGAGAAPENPSPVLKTKARAEYRPMRSTASPSASRTTKLATPDPTDSTTEPTEATTSPSPSAEPSTPPTESTSDPTDAPTDGGGDSDVPPSSPPTDSEPT
jgi:hypothetical protein